MITLIDYGVGNLRSVQNALKFLGYPVSLTTDKKQIENADLIVLPGQGAFGEAMQNLRDLGLVEIIKSHIKFKRPFLGICVGFQILFESSEEMGNHKGLGVFPGHMTLFDKSKLTVPHMGWNQLTIVSDPNEVFAGIPKNPTMYFANSYYVPESTGVSATTRYGVEFVSVVQGPNLLAAQFHPEKSGPSGLSLLSNFLSRVITP